MARDTSVYNVLRRFWVSRAGHLPKRDTATLLERCIPSTFRGRGPGGNYSSRSRRSSSSSDTREPRSQFHSAYE